MGLRVGLLAVGLREVGGVVAAVDVVAGLGVGVSTGAWVVWLELLRVVDLLCPRLVGGGSSWICVCADCLEWSIGRRVGRECERLIRGWQSV